MAKILILRKEGITEAIPFERRAYESVDDRSRDGQNNHMLMILKSKSNHINKGDLKSKSLWKC